MITRQITEQQNYLLDLVESGKPFEIIEIHMDKEGRANTFLIKRSQKVMVSEITICAVK